MTTVAWIDGQVRHGPDAMVAVTDPGLLHGIGVFETTRVHDGVPFALFHPAVGLGDLVKIKFQTLQILIAFLQGLYGVQWCFSRLGMLNG